MKTLVNKANPAFRITSPEIIEEEEYYTFDGETVFLKEYWILVEEEPKHTEVWLEGRTIFEQEQPKGDLAENIEMEWDSFNKNVAEYGGESEDVVWLNWFSFTDIATYFYNLGLNARKEK